LRITKLTDELIAEAYKYIAAGNFAVVACKALGIAEKTYYYWLKKGEKDEDSIYGKFCKSIKKARAEAEIRNVALLQKAANSSWQAAAWYLERTTQRWRNKIEFADNFIPVKIVDDITDNNKKYINNKKKEDYSN